MEVVKKSKIKNNRVDKDSDKYKVLLKFVNKILTNLNKAEVDDLTQFINIDRDDIIKDINKDSLVAMEDELFPLFDKSKVGYYRQTDSRALSILRGLVKEAGYDLVRKKKEKSDRFNNYSYRRTHIFYSIQ